MALDGSLLAHMELDQACFEKVSRVLHQYAGITLNTGKQELVRSRLGKRMRATGIFGFKEYLKYVENDATGRELHEMIDALTTNKTSFFREEQHFDYLRTCVLPKMQAANRKLRIWSAGCSTGEEPYTLAIVLRESNPDIDKMDVKILATDISSRVLACARKAEYTEDKLSDLPPGMLQKYFTPVDGEPSGSWRVNDSVRKMVTLANVNLMNQWSMHGPFQIIFCRNVMIYFDRPTQMHLVRRFWDMLDHGGYLFVGHSESLLGSADGFKYARPAVYTK